MVQIVILFCVFLYHSDDPVKFLINNVDSRENRPSFYSQVFKNDTLYGDDFFDRTFQQKREFFLGQFAGNLKCNNFNSEHFDSHKLREQSEKEQLSYYQNISWLKKTIFPSSRKVVFVVGFEGTGHHFLQTAWKYTCEKYISKNLCKEYHQLSQIIRCGQMTPTLETPQKLLAIRRSVEKYSSRLLILNTYGKYGQQSYPYCRMKNTTNVPNVRLLAELIQKMGFDFYIILLHRNPESIIVSTTMKRKMDKNMLSKCQSYLFVIKSMILQLLSMDRSFIAGKISIDRSKPENLNMNIPLMVQKLGVTEDEANSLFDKFSQTKKDECVDSFNYHNDQLELCRSNLYSWFYFYERYFEFEKEGEAGSILFPDQLALI